MADMNLLQRYLGLKADHAPELPMFMDVVFISIDLEAYEFAQHKITEVGISSLDTRDLAGISPGANAATWLEKIQARHIRIEEHQRLVNKKFIKGCPDKFNFGESEVVPVRQTGPLLASIFRNPSITYAGTDQHKTKEQRSIVLVGHGLKNDTKYLQRLHFDPNIHGNIIKTLDTQSLCGSTKRNTVGLEKLLRALQIQATNLHNAGNDAAYTLQALILMCIHHLQSPGKLGVDIAALKSANTQPKHQYKLAQRAKKQALAEAEALSKANTELGQAPKVVTEQVASAPDGVQENPMASKTEAGGSLVGDCGSVRVRQDTRRTNDGMEAASAAPPLAKKIKRDHGA